MKVRSKLKILILTLLFLAVAIFLPSFFIPQDTASANIKNDNVVYNSVEKKIIIDKNKNCDITERITVTYLKAGINVGLARNVSRVNKITRLVGGREYVKTTLNTLELLSVTMDGEEEYNFLETAGDYFYINTGADGDYKVGTHVYEIHYLYGMGEDFITAFDDFTFDIMDYGFKSEVGSFSAEITLPKDFLCGKAAEEVLSFRTNGMSPLGYEDVKANIDEENFTLNCEYGKLAKEHGLTVQLILPQGYFDTSYTPDAMYFVTLGLSIAAVAAIALIIFLSRRTFGSVVTTEFYPPDGYSPLDVARAYRGKLCGKDFAALVISWASKGLVSIRLVGKKDMVLTRLKYHDSPEATPYSGYERDFFNRLFGIYSTFDSRRKLSNVEKSDLYEVVKKLRKPSREKLIKLVLRRVLISVVSVIPFICSLVWNNSYMDYGSFMAFLIIFPLIALNVFIYIPMPLWFKILWCGFFGGAPLGVLIATSLCTYDIYYLLIITAAIFISGTFSSVLVGAFDNADKSVRGKILGFKKFLILAELDKLNALLEENPEYFYDILPYCYVFGITKKMQKKFSALNIPLPGYFNGGTMQSVGNGISHAMHDVCGSSSHASSGGGSSGGGGGGGSGGSSGGGGGGGGCSGR